MWEKIEKPKTVLASKALVKEFYGMEPLPRDRPMSERRLMICRRLLKLGEFRPVTWASAFCAETGQTIRVNGKHTSTVLHELIDAGEELPEFFVTIERYSCPTLEDVAKLYATFDSNISSRTSNDIIYSFAATVKAFDGLKKKTLPLAVGAAAYQKWGPGFYSQHPPAERAELILDHIEFTTWLDSVLWPHGERQKEAAHVWRAAVVAAMLGTFNRSQKDADAFWKAVRDETDPSRDSPTRKLARLLKQKTVRSAMVAPKGKEVVTFREMYVKCLHAWNAYRGSATTDLKYFPQAKVPAIK